MRTLRSLGAISRLLVQVSRRFLMKSIDSGINVEQHLREAAPPRIHHFRPPQAMESTHVSSSHIYTLTHTRDSCVVANSSSSAYNMAGRDQSPSLSRKLILSNCKSSGNTSATIRPSTVVGRLISSDILRCEILGPGMTIRCCIS